MLLLGPSRASRRGVRARWLRGLALGNRGPPRARRGRRGHARSAAPTALFPHEGWVLRALALRHPSLALDVLVSTRALARARSIRSITPAARAPTCCGHEAAVAHTMLLLGPSHAFLVVHAWCGSPIAAKITRKRALLTHESVVELALPAPHPIFTVRGGVGAPARDDHLLAGTDRVEDEQARVLADVLALAIHVFRLQCVRDVHGLLEGGAWLQRPNFVDVPAMDPVDPHRARVCVADRQFHLEHRPDPILQLRWLVGRGDALLTAGQSAESLAGQLHHEDRALLLHDDAAAGLPGRHTKEAEHRRALAGLQRRRDVMPRGEQELLPPNPVPLLAPLRERVGKLRVQQRLHTLRAARVVEGQDHIAVQLVVTSTCADAPEFFNPGNGCYASPGRPLPSGPTR
mmetsp:Transcript_250/g.667  ORF Transcript_250/g.667 Transcript_250/m.667 type:complete len:403 (-) Transcript_250:372-1580(-)